MRLLIIKSIVMKQTILTILGVWFVAIGFAQTNGKSVTELEEVTIKPINLTYLNAVYDERMPAVVNELENRAARYDVTSSEVYNEDFEAYEVVFEKANSSIIATYDDRGRIMESLERFKDITLPKNIRDQISAQHPGWSIHKDVYLVSYYYDKGIEKSCKVQLRKAGKKKNIKINLSNVNQ